MELSYHWTTNQETKSWHCLPPNKQYALQPPGEPYHRPVNPLKIVCGNQHHQRIDYKTWDIFQDGPIAQILLSQRDDDLEIRAKSQRHVHGVDAERQVAEVLGDAPLQRFL